MAALVGLGAPLAAGQTKSPEDQGAAATPYHFDVATIKPNNTGVSRGFVPGFTVDEYRADYVRLRLVIMQAYGIQAFQMSGGPAWIDAEAFNIEAKTDEATADALSKLRPDQLKLARQQMLRSFLEERFGLKVHQETKEGPIYSLVIAKGGAKLEASKSSDGVLGPDGNFTQGYCRRTEAGLICSGLSAQRIATLLSQNVRRPVLDKTGLTGTYDFTLEWARDLAVAPPPDGEDSDAQLMPGGVTIFAAVQQQLGLKLEPGRGPVETLVIDHAEKPSAN